MFLRRYTRTKDGKKHTLDYSGFTGDIKVNLRRGTATVNLRRGTATELGFHRRHQGELAPGHGGNPKPGDILTVVR